jgi:hypothetical protein
MTGGTQGGSVPSRFRIYIRPKSVVPSTPRPLYHFYAAHPLERAFNAMIGSGYILSSYRDV